MCFRWSVLWIPSVRPSAWSVRTSRGSSRRGPPGFEKPWHGMTCQNMICSICLQQYDFVNPSCRTFETAIMHIYAWSPRNAWSLDSNSSRTRFSSSILFLFWNHHQASYLMLDSNIMLPRPKSFKHVFKGKIELNHMTRIRNKKKIGNTTGSRAYTKSDISSLRRYLCISNDA